MSEEEKSINYIKIKEHWMESSESDFNTMLNLYKSGDYHWSLFIGHLVLERLLKAVYVEINKKHAPYLHDLMRLAKYCDIEISEIHKEWLDTITTFNINARYESYKKEFYKKCTKIYAEEWVDKIKILREWIKNKL
jgi:HEPN domain-containing protein